MKKKHVLSLALVICLLLNCAVLPAQAYNPNTVDCINTYVNTGNQRQDIVGVALTQLGYMELEENDTKYCDWYGLPHNPWCAMFVSWCARQAEVSTDILARNAWAHPKYFDIPYYSGETYTPQPGDLFFTTDFEHVGLVWYVEGEYFYCIEGNGKPHDPSVPNDPDVDSYHVLTNKRLIRAHYFGVPAYEGCDQEHTYVRGVENTHPHKAYYQCSTCGDKYYTGYTDCLLDCSSCLSCGCSAAYAGYYELLPNTEYLRIRTGHSMSYDTLCYVTLGSVVYVYGIDKDTGWAYIDFDGIRGHIPSSYLKAYPDAPDAPIVTSPQTSYIKNDHVDLHWNTPANTEQFRLTVYKDNLLYLEQYMALCQGFTLNALPAGTYKVHVNACNRAGASAAGTLTFIVRDTYTVTYDPREGSGAPESQTQAIGETITLSSTIPTREGYTFLGWTDDSSSNFASYLPGHQLQTAVDTTLYAVWQENGATPLALTIGQLPSKTIYLINAPLDTKGLALHITYSDGSGQIVTQGYTTDGFDASSYGTKTITVSYLTLTTTYDVRVVDYIPGDIDLNTVVDRDDVMQLLWHISFPDRFPVIVPSDFTGDGIVDRDDVMQLLWHISFPDRFPLEVTATAEGE